MNENFFYFIENGRSGPGGTGPVPVASSVKFIVITVVQNWPKSISACWNKRIYLFFRFWTAVITNNKTCFDKRVDGKGAKDLNTN
jgi:hypothetical protein